MNYEEALAYIHTVTWRGSIPGLSRTQELLRRLGNPERSLRFVHIAGTNGKGSTSAMMASILHAAGYRVGLYVSPFIDRFNERMQINGVPIPDEMLAALTAEVYPHAEAMAEHPTEFELITSIAMLYFTRSRCDIVVLEVGMGGALDSTNVIDTPELAVITAMGLDHMRFLGNTLAEISAQKAGIIKEGGDVVIYGRCPEAETVFEQRCAERHARLHRPDAALLRPGVFGLNGQSFSYGAYSDLWIPLVGSYQPYNAAVVLTGVDVLRQKGWQIPQSAVREGLRRVSWPARFEVLRHADPVCIVDGGHNPHGIRGTADSLLRLFPHTPVTFVIGVMADKDVDGILDILLPLAARCFTVRPDSPRAMDPAALAAAISARGVRAEACPMVADGVQRAVAAAGQGGVVCALGSLYMAGDVRSLFRSADLLTEQRTEADKGV